MTLRHTVLIRIAGDHASLAGHFPGEPIVPGVVLLDRVLGAAEQHLGRTLRVMGLDQVKFPCALRPEEEASAVLEMDGTRLGFEVARDGRVIARGAFRLAPDGAP